MLAVLAAAVAVPTLGPRSTHHQELRDGYDASKTRCPGGRHRGVIVRLHEDSSMEPGALLHHLQGKHRSSDRFGHVFATPHTIRGISAHLTEESLEEMMRDGELHGIQSVHADCLRQTTLPRPAQHPSESHLMRSNIGAHVATVGKESTVGVQKDVNNWGLDVCSKLSGSDGGYAYGNATGRNTILYHVDTGVEMTHTEFTRQDESGNVLGSRIIDGWSMGCSDLLDDDQKEDCSTLWVYGANITDDVLNRVNELPDDNAEEAKVFALESTANVSTLRKKRTTPPGKGCDAHGTHTASIVLGNRYGVAKEANLVAVQGLSCIATAQDSLVVKALEQIVMDARARSPYMPGVVLLSLGGDQDVPLNEAVKRTTQHHINVVVAAGNDHVNSCTTTPSSVTRAMTVAAVAENDHLASFSSYGKCVDMCAPGTSIVAGYAVVGSQSGVASLSGTSMAAPFVAGAMLQALSVYPQMTTGQTKRLLGCVGAKERIFGERQEELHTPNILVRFGDVFSSPRTIRAAIDEANHFAQERGSGVQSQEQGLALRWDSAGDTDFHDDCLKLIDKLDASRPADGILKKSPDVNNIESVIISDEDLPPARPTGAPDTKPYDQAEDTGALVPPELS